MVGCAAPGRGLKEDAIRYSPALTGLRGAAVLAVVWLHAAFASGVALPGGFFGVDVFFVLSAFLITALLVAEFHARDRIDLRMFYARRALRLLPALLAALVLVAVLRLTVGPVGSGLLRQGVATLLYVANWNQLLAAGQTGYLDHTWSLAIEEQFYLAWPVTLLLLLRRGVAPARLARWTAGLAVVAFLARWAAYAVHPGDPVDGFELYYLNPFARLDELLIGVTLGLLPRSAWSATARWAVPALAGLVALVHVARLRAPFVYEWGLTATAVCAVVVVAAAATGEGPVARLLSWRPLVALGTISYGLYLYHLPIVLALLTFDLPVPVRVALGVLLPLPVAAASWRWLEQPALRRKHRFEPARAAA